MTRVELPYDTIDSLTDLNTAVSVNILLVSSDAQFNHILGPKIQSRLHGKHYRIHNPNFYNASQIL